MASERQYVLDLLKTVFQYIHDNYDSFHQFLVKTRDSLGEVYESLRKMRENSEGKYTECCNKLIAVVEEALRYFDEVQESLAFSRIQLDMLNHVVQTESDPLNCSAMKDLVTQLKKCISRIQKFQSEFSKRCDDAIAGANEMAVACEGLAARAHTAKVAAQAVRLFATISGAAALGLVTAGISTAVIGATVGATVGVVTVAGGGMMTYTWANDYEEVKEFIEMNEKLKALQQNSYELQAILSDSRQIVEKLEPLTDTIDRLSTGDGEIHNCEEAFQSLVEELKQIHREHTSLNSPQENLKAIRKKLKRSVAIEPEDCTEGKKIKQS